MTFAALSSLTDHVSSRQRRDCQSVSFALQSDVLRVFELNDFVKGRVDVVQREDFEFFVVLMRLVQIVHEHLTHFVDWNGGVDRAVESAFADHVRQRAQM